MELSWGGSLKGTGRRAEQPQRRVRVASERVRGPLPSPRISAGDDDDEARAVAARATRDARTAREMASPRPRDRRAHQHCAALVRTDVPSRASVAGCLSGVDPPAPPRPRGARPASRDRYAVPVATRTDRPWAVGAAGEMMRGSTMWEACSARSLVFVSTLE